MPELCRVSHIRSRVAHNMWQVWCSRWRVWLVTCRVCTLRCRVWDLARPSWIQPLWMTCHMMLAMSSSLSHLACSSHPGQQHRDRWSLGIEWHAHQRCQSSVIPQLGMYQIKLGKNTDWRLIVQPDNLHQWVSLIIINCYLIKSLSDKLQCCMYKYNRPNSFWHLYHQFHYIPLLFLHL